MRIRKLFGRAVFSRTWGIGTLWWVLGALSVVWSAEPQITATVSPQAVIVGAQVTYNVSIKVGDAAAMRNQGPALRGAPACPLLRTVSPRPSSRNQVQIINGAFQQSYELTWKMQAMQEGDGQIAGLQIEIGGQAYPVPPAAIKVAKSAEDTLPASLKSGDLLPATTGEAEIDQQLRGRLFATLTFSKTEVYLQEPIMVDCVVYADGIRLIENSFGWKPEGLKDFVVGETSFADQGWRQGTLGGRQYSVRTVARYYLVPTRVGEVEIPLTNAVCQVPVTTSDPFFGNDPFLGNIMGTQAAPVSMPVRGTKIRVKPLPTQGQPPSFQNAVGNFTFAARVNSQAISEDDLLTLTFEVGGAGYLGSITAPGLPDMKDWKVTGKPSEKVEGAKANPLFEGKKVFEYVLRPTRSGALEVPQIAYAFFNPDQNRFVEVQRGPFKVNVTRGQQRQLQVATSTVSSDSPNPPTASEPPATPEQLAYLHTTLPSALTVVPFYRQGIFPLLLGLPVALLGLAVGFRGWTEYRLRHEGEFALRQAGGRARKELKTARASLKSGQLEAFHSQLAEALRGYIATKIQRSAKGLTFEEIQEACEARGLPAEKARGLRRLLERCDGARYHAGGGDPAVVEELLREAEALLDAMDQVFG